MGFAEDIAKVADGVRAKADRVVGEQATKMSLIAPFLMALGYDVFDSSEVIPEYIADFAIKSGGHLEKVDYAIAINNTIVMIFEAKARDKKPEVHDKQLKKYLNSLVDTKVAVITNGIEYRFFTDLRLDNIMDDEPFFDFNILEYSPKDLEDLKFFHKDNYDTTEIKKRAEEMVYATGMAALVDELLRSPSKEFIRFLLRELGKIAPKYEIDGQINDKKIQRFSPIVKKAVQNSLVDLMTRSINQEIGQPDENTNLSDSINIDEIDDQDDQEIEEFKVETTVEEMEFFERVKLIVARSKVCQLGIKSKDVISYFGLNVGKSTWWFLRFYSSSKKKSFVTRLPIEQVRALATGFEVQEMTASFGDATSRVIISSVNDLDNLSELILKCYEAEAVKHLAVQVA
jgi:hypothetical protein